MSHKEVMDKLREQLAIATTHERHFQFIVLSIPEAQALLTTIAELQQDLADAQSGDLPS